jgi:RNA 2',3'-cyclic 3'-phosphodiesterase
MHTGTVRLFVAVVPPPDVLAAVARLPRPDVPGVRWSTRDQWHVTLRFLGEVDDPDAVVAALESADLAPAAATLGPGVAVLGRSVLVIPVAGLDDLAASVVAATSALGRPPEDRAFRGHLTLARARRGASVRGPARRLADDEVAATFPVGEVRLVRSRLGPDGARYDDLFVRRLDADDRGP